MVGYLSGCLDHTKEAKGSGRGKGTVRGRPLKVKWSSCNPPGNSEGTVAVCTTNTCTWTTNSTHTGEREVSKHSVTVSSTI